MARLREITAGNEFNNVVLDGLERHAPILQDAEFYTRRGDLDRVKDAREGAAKAKITRSLNENNTATAATPTYTNFIKSIVSFDAKVDPVIEDRNEDPETELIYQLRAESEEASWTIQELFFEGDTGTDAEDFDGMRNLVDPAWVIVTDTNGTQLPVGGDAVLGTQQTAIERLMQHFQRVRGGASHAYMNEFLKIRLLTVAKALGFYRQSKDELGNMIDMIGNVIIRGAGYQKDGSTLLPFNETVGTSNDCSSMFLVRWAERSDLTALTSVGVSARYAGQVGNELICNVNLDCVLGVQNPTAIVQSQGWRL